MRSVGEGIPGYVTPKIAIGAVVGNDDEELLLIQRSDSGFGYFLPVLLTWGIQLQKWLKRVLEETGMEVEALRIISILDGVRGGFTRMPLYSIVSNAKFLEEH